VKLGVKIQVANVLNLTSPHFVFMAKLKMGHFELWIFIPNLYRPISLEGL